MRHIFTLFCVAFLANISLSQEYFQQEVNYKIDVELDDENHILRGFEHFEYINNSQQSLTEIKIHLWPNAYKNASTALAKQKQRKNDDGLIYASEEERGWIDSLDFKANGKSLELVYDEDHIDMATLKLNESLAPGEKVTISTPFKVKIPNAKYSRLGHVGESYMITQWYPKPAVFDKNGWHHMPYLNQGEFYSEYGSFEVSITLPENYVVGATGDLQNQSEISWLQKKADSTLNNYKESNYSGVNSMDFPASSKQTKTLTYKQSKVHDFAWFADKRFQVLKGEVELPHSKRTVTSYAMFTPKNAKLWEDAIEYLNDGTYYYSKWNGDYPYNQVTAVDGTIAAGGGMEYPNVTVIGNTGNKKTLEVVIVHEVGHNWFYGILGSNERDHAWMDEGLNTLNEVRYIQTKYPNNTRLSDQLLNGAFRFHDCDYHDQNDLFFRTVQSLGVDQPMEMSSDDFATVNYGVVVYQKTGLVFDYMKEYLGVEKFDIIMHEYFDKWKFKHPQPEDLQAVFEEITKEDLDWFFKDIIQTANPIDYKLKSVKEKDGNTEVKIKSKGHIHGPIPVTMVTEENDTLVQMAKAGEKVRTLTFPITGAKEVIVDYNKQVPELNRTNNSWKKDWLLNKVEPVKLNGIFTANRREESNLAWLPMIGVNTSDKFMIGASIHNFQLPLNKFSFVLTPMYSFGRNNLSGMGEFMYHLSPSRIAKNGKLGLSLKTFKDDDSFDRNEANFYSVNPYLFLNLGKKGPISKHSNTLMIQAMYKGTRRGAMTVNEAGGFVEHKYIFSIPNHIFKTRLRGEYIQSDLNDELGRITASANYRFQYKIKNSSHYAEIRLFGASNVIPKVNSAYNFNRYGIPVSGRNGSQDLFVEEYYFGRNETSGMWSQQFNEDMGNIKSASSLTADDWMLTTNLYATIPGTRGILGAFADYGVYQNLGSQEQVYDVGLGLRLGGFFGLYVPLLQGGALDVPNSNFGQSIKFSLHFNIVNDGLIDLISNI